ncbi:MAG: sel1 repeat family protein, partial [Rhodoferax sp.]|nr:sel1 repeat family protein [Rhodoferax sp.]
MKTITRLALAWALAVWHLCAGAQSIPLALEAYGQGQFETARAILNYGQSMGWKSAPVVKSLLFRPDGSPASEARQKEALAKLLAEADKGNPASQYALGFMDRYGVGVANKDGGAAFAWFSKSAAKGNAAAQHNLSELYLEGRAVARDDALALYWMTKAAEQGYASSQVNLGYRYLDGRGVAVDEAQALAWFKKAADQGSAMGLEALGWAYRNG